MSKLFAFMLLLSSVWAMGQTQPPRLPDKSGQNPPKDMPKQGTPPPKTPPSPKDMP